MKIELFYTPESKEYANARDELSTAAEEIIPGVTGANSTRSMS